MQVAVITTRSCDPEKNFNRFIWIIDTMSPQNNSDDCCNFIYLFFINFIHTHTHENIEKNKIKSSLYNNTPV